MVVGLLFAGLLLGLGVWAGLQQFDTLRRVREEPYMPVTIAIYRLPLQESFPDRRELEQEIRITVLHELGHYFGMDERELDELGYG